MNSLYYSIKALYLSIQYKYILKETDILVFLSSFFKTINHDLASFFLNEAQLRSQQRIDIKAESYVKKVRPQYTYNNVYLYTKSQLNMLEEKHAQYCTRFN